MCGFKLTQINALNINLLSKYYNTLNVLNNNNNYFIEPLFEDFTKSKAHLYSSFKDKYKEFLISYNNSEIGFLNYMIYNFEGKPKELVFYIDILPENLSNELNLFLAQKMLFLINFHNTNKAKIYSTDIKLINLCKELNFEPINEYFYLKLNNLDKNNVSIIESDYSNYKINTYNKISDNLAELIANSTIEIAKDAKFYTNDFNYCIVSKNDILSKQNFIINNGGFIVCATIDNEFNEIIGFTYILFSKNSSKFIGNQCITFIEKNYRGQNLALFFKYNLYKIIFENFSNIDYIFSEVSVLNNKMLKINAHLGYTKIESGVEFGIKDSILKNYINSNLTNYKPH